jgi:hypothetical protein
MRAKLSCALIALALSASSATAQTAGGNYASLSSGQQKIVDALHGAQTPPSGAQALTKDQLAARNGSSGWGNVFKDLKAQGYYPNAKNLGDVISAHAHQRNDLRREARTTVKADHRVDKSAGRPEKVERFSRPDKPEKPERVGRH